MVRTSSVSGEPESSPERAPAPSRGRFASITKLGAMNIGEIPEL